MTNEEAIKMLNKWGVFLPSCTDEALGMAIEELKQVTGKLRNPDDSLLTEDAEACKEQKSKLDLISRQDALKPFCISPKGTRIPEVDCDNFPVEFSVKFIKKHLLSLPSAERPYTGCSGCVHYDQQETALICHFCKRFYEDKYKDGEKHE